MGIFSTLQILAEHANTPTGRRYWALCINKRPYVYYSNRDEIDRVCKSINKTRILGHGIPPFRVRPGPDLPILSKLSFYLGL